VAAFADRLLLARAGTALAIANLRFWTTVAPLVRTHLARWEQRAKAIKDPALQALALSKLRDEHFNAEVAATLATLCGTCYRPTVVEALVAYEILYDYLDGLTELPSAEPLRDGHQLYRALTDAVAVDSTTTSANYFLYHSATDGGYLDELVRVVRAALAVLPSSPVIIPVSWRATERCAEAQVRAHAVPRLGVGQLERWAKHEAETLIHPFAWQGFLAGAASSVLTSHALIAASADGNATIERASAIDTVYFSTAVLSTLLDGLVDYEEDERKGRVSYLRYYPDAELLTADLLSATRTAMDGARRLPNEPHHMMTIVGVVAYYLSAAGGRNDYTRTVTRPLADELAPLLGPTLAIMGMWRAAKRARAYADAQFSPSRGTPDDGP
jgi:tetraprenyl-beta-curcumene synthase